MEWNKVLSSSFSSTVGAMEHAEWRQSMSRADNPYDNAFMVPCFSRFKTELLQDSSFDNLQDAYTEIFEYIEMYYNTKRRHSSLNYECPNNFEKNYFSTSPKQPYRLSKSTHLTRQVKKYSK
jgi:transposase InsO family protein